MIVVDASVVVTALADNGADGEELRSRLQADGDLHAPEVLDLEVAAVLRRLVVMERALGPRRASRALEDLADLPVERYSHRPLLGRVWALRHNLPAYDAAYVALAEALGAVLLTADRRLARCPGLRCELELVSRT
ncbi:MAG TPA: type II toxin-antitoxin system VapC family toxin [Acidimicrobiales bacterium]|nr:type II toxin-antitoxin system VapC family toxin [Acidimicrobiales bacterium]